MRISDWSSDVCSSDLPVARIDQRDAHPRKTDEIAATKDFLRLRGRQPFGRVRTLDRLRQRIDRRHRRPAHAREPCEQADCFEHLRLPSPPEMPSDAPHDKASFLDKAMRIIDDLAMDRAQLPLNALRAFEAAARHLNFTRAGLELHVSQGAVSHQVAELERRLGTRLFHRLPRGLALTDEGHALVPVVAEAFDRVAATLDQYTGGRFREALKVGVVGTFATGWLLPRLEDRQSKRLNSSH